MYKLNSLQYPEISTITIDETYSVEPLKNNTEFENLISNFTSEFGFEKLNTFSFTKNGFLSLMIELNGTIAVSLGECEAIVQGAKLFEKLGNKVVWIGLNAQGELNYDELKTLKCDYIFVSSYVMDTFVQINLEKVKELTSGKVISNFSANKYAKFADIALFDSYKISGFGVCGIALYSNDEFEEQSIAQTDALGVRLTYDALNKQIFVTKNKEEFIEVLKSEFGENLHFFVEPDSTLPYTLHFGLKGVKARNMIRTLNLNSIYITNGEGCSLGLSRPSKIVQNMGYSECDSRWALSFTFVREYTSEEINEILKTMSKKYRQIKALS